MVEREGREEMAEKGAMEGSDNEADAGHVVEHRRHFQPWFLHTLIIERQELFRTTTRKCIRAIGGYHIARKDNSPPTYPFAFLIPRNVSLNNDPDRPDNLISVHHFSIKM